VTGPIALGRLHHATVVCRDLQRSIDFYRTVLGYVDVETDRLAIAGDGGGVMLGSPGAASGFVRLVPRPDATARHPLTAPGWSTLELIVADVDAVAEHVAGLGDVTVVTPPSRAGATGQLGVYHVLGPDGEIVYLTEILARHDRYELPPTPAVLVGPVFIGVWATSSLETDRAWFEERFAVTRVSDRKARLRAVNWARRRPADDEYRISSLHTGDQSLIEIDDVDGLVAPGAAASEPTLSGISSITFASRIGRFMTITSARRYCDDQRDH